MSMDEFLVKTAIIQTSGAPRRKRRAALKKLNREFLNKPTKKKG